MDVAALMAAGLYDPDAPTAADRLALLEYLVGRGATVAEMVEADADGVLFALSAYLAAFAPVERLPLSDVAARSGTSVDGIRRLLLAEGLPVDEATLLPAYVVDDAAAFRTGASLFGEEATLAFTRVIGASVARIVDAAISLFYGEFSVTAPADGTELERARANARAGAVFAVLPSVITHLLEQCFRLNSARAASARGDALGQTATVGVGFVDLVDSTVWAAQLSLKDHALALARFESAAWNIATGHGGRVVKLIGDEAMIVASSAETVCRIAVELCDTVTADPALPGVRAGVGYGDVTWRGGDYVGPLVNLVARSVKVATAGSVVVTAEARHQLGAGGPWRVTDIGSHALRGIEEPVPLFTVVSG
ncbi:MAG TPA: adenylate/guanylate cyclase domain-containing protein [Acidimicrobiales bacterium]|nr:adenylate/guanylate cyclase domain-containing protein [Acidimicrobiales bacterium]